MSKGTPVNASAVCLCPPQTTMAIQDQVKRELISEKCKDYEVFFDNSYPGFFCDPAAGKKNAKMNAEGYPLKSRPEDFGKSFSIYNNGIKNILLEVDVYSPEKRVISEVASSVDVGSENRYYIPFEENDATFEVSAKVLIASNLKKDEYCLCDNDENDFRCKNNDALLNQKNTKDNPELAEIYKEYCKTPVGLFASSVNSSSSASFSLRRGANFK